MNTHLFPRLPILIVDDETDALEGFEIALAAAGYTNVATLSDSREVLPWLRDNEAELILLDLIMPFLNGMELLDKIKEFRPQTPVIIVTAVSEIESVVSCIRKGALDYILKPVESESLCNRVRKCLELRELERENVLLRESLLTGNLHHPEVFADIVTRDPAMLSIFHYCEAVSVSSKPVLITGETGTGKELIARAIHRLSKRSGEFVAVNVAAFDDAMFADALFGHIRGAFTGADQPRQGLVARANGGTLFLDEIGDLPMISQVKLLRLLQEQEYFPVGSDTPRRANIRVISSTLRDMAELKKSNRFREDLYYRFATHHVRLPPLRLRKGDIEPLLERFLELEAAELNKTTPSYHPELIALLKSYSFPGNVREFRAMVADALANHTSRMLSSVSFRRFMSGDLAPGAVSSGPADPVPQEPECDGRIPSLKEAVEKLSRALIAKAMRLSGGNQTIAARHLGITQQGLSAKLKKLGLPGRGLPED